MSREGIFPKSKFQLLCETPPMLDLKSKNDAYLFLRETFEYRPKSGELIRIKAFHTNHVGKNAIVQHPNGDNDLVRIGKRTFAAWKVIFYLQKGAYLSNHYICEFIDGDKHNHKADNLRIITRSAWMHNRCEFLNFGIFTRKHNNKYFVKIKTPNKGDTYLGSFDDKQQARIAYMKAKLEIRNDIKKWGVL